MQSGVNMFCTHLAIRPDELARAVEERGFESLWMPEHTHIPADKKGPGGDPLPEEYWHTCDPFVALTAAAMATKRLKICTGVCLVIERDPITTAKEVASLDDLSGGRFIFGIGAGWNREELDNGSFVEKKPVLQASSFKTTWEVAREASWGTKEIVDRQRELARLAAETWPLQP